MDPRRALSFGAAAEAYAAARPSYPADAVRYAIGDAQRVIDLGAGTGKLTSVVLELAAEVIAVEPDDAMRALIDPRADVRAGTAEAVPVDDGWADALVVGQAWHWFDHDHDLAVASVNRVLRPGGRLGLIWNVLDDTSGWAADVVALLNLEDRLSLATKDATRDEGSYDGLSAWSREYFANPQPADAELFLTNLRSRSLVILTSDEERDALFDQVRAVLPTGAFDIPWVCETWFATKR